MKQLYFIYNKFGDIINPVYGPPDVDIYFWWDKFKERCEYPHPEDYDDDEWWNRYFESERIANELGYDGGFEDAFVNYLIKHHEFELAEAARRAPMYGTCPPGFEEFPIDGAIYPGIRYDIEPDWEDRVHWRHVRLWTPNDEPQPEEHTESEELKKEEPTVKKLFVESAGFVVMNDALIAALKTLKAGQRGKPKLPVLTTVSFTRLDDNTLELFSTNLDMGVIVEVPSRVDADFPGICLPYDALVKALPKLFNTDETLTVRVDYKTLKATITQGESVFTVNGMDIDEFPIRPNLGDYERIAHIIDTPAFVAAAKHVLLAATREDNRPILTALAMQKEGDDMVLAAADGYRLHTAVLPVGMSQDIALPVAESVKLMLPLLNSSKSVEVYFRTAPEYDTILFVQSGFTAIMMSVQGKFPDYRAIMPKRADFMVYPDPKKMLTVLDGLGVLAKDSANTIYIDRLINDGSGFGSLILGAKSQELGEATKTIPATVHTGVPFAGEVVNCPAFNMAYMAEALKSYASMNASNVEIGFTEYTAPMRLRPNHRPDGVLDIEDVVMPMSIYDDTRKGTKTEFVPADAEAYAAYQELVASQAEAQLADAYPPVETDEDGASLAAGAAAGREGGRVAVVK